MKKLAIMVVSFSLFSLTFLSAPFADETETTKEDARSWSIEITADVWSKYLDDVGFVYFARPTLMTTIAVYGQVWGQDMYAGVFTATDLGEKFFEGQGKDIYAYIGFDKTLSLPWLDEINLNIEVGYDDCNKVFSRTEGDAFSTTVKVTKTFQVNEKHTVEPGFQFDTFFPVTQDDGGTIITPLIKYTWTPTERITVSNTIALPYDDGALGAEKGMIFRYDASVGWKVSAHWEASVFLRATAPVWEAKDRDPEVAGGAGLKYLNDWLGK